MGDMAKVANALGGYNVAELGSVTLSEPKPVLDAQKEPVLRKNGEPLMFRYINGLTSGVDKNGVKKEGTLQTIFVDKLFFKGEGKENKPYYVERKLGFFDKEQNKTVIKDHRRDQNRALCSEIAKGSAFFDRETGNQIGNPTPGVVNVLLEDLNKDKEGEKSRLVVGTPESHVKYLMAEKAKRTAGEQAPANEVPAEQKAPVLDELPEFNDDEIEIPF